METNFLLSGFTLLILEIRLRDQSSLLPILFEIGETKVGLSKGFYGSLSVFIKQFSRKSKLRFISGLLVTDFSFEIGGEFSVSVEADACLFKIWIVFVTCLKESVSWLISPWSGLDSGIQNSSFNFFFCWGVFTTNGCILSDCWNVYDICTYAVEESICSTSRLGLFLSMFLSSNGFIFEPFFISWMGRFSN